MDVLDLLVQSEDKALNLLVKFLSLNPKFVSNWSNLKLNFLIYWSSEFLDRVFSQSSCFTGRAWS